jgi:hypothetical protein
MDDVSRAGSPSDAVVARLQRMEETVAGLGREVRTRRLKV